MQDDVDIFEVLASMPNEATPLPSRAVLPEFPPSPRAELPPITIRIERDLAVMLVGSDAGREGRIKPHSSMTRGVSPRETEHLRTLMEPFLQDEVRRVRVDRTHKPIVSTVRATPPQALSLKAACVRFAAFQRDHLAKDPQGDRNHRSRQRLGQAYHVIDQVNAALGLCFDDGRTLEQCRREVITQIESLEATLGTFLTRAEAVGPGEVIVALPELRAAMRLCLDRCRQI